MLTLGKDVFMHKLFCERNITESETVRLSLMRMSSTFALVTSTFKKEKNIYLHTDFPLKLIKRKKNK